MKDDSDPAVLLLEGDAYALTIHPPRRFEDPLPAAGGGAWAFLLRASTSEGPTWAVVSSGVTAVRVNGIPVTLGLRVLSDRDEIVVEGHDYFFSTERLAAVEPFPATEQTPSYCPRCKLALEPGQPAVRCPQCSIWHHEDEDKARPCWSYAHVCASCPQPTDLDAGFRWIPGEM